MRRIISRIAAVVSACLLMLGIVVAGPGSAQATVTPPPDVDWAELYLPMFNPTGCLDVPSGSKSSGTALQIFHCHGYAANGAPQRWSFSPMFTGGYEIWNPNTLLCITPTGSGSRVEERFCGAFAGQDWNLVDDPRAPGARFQLVNVTFPNMCLVAGSASNNATVRMTTCSQANNDMWALG